MAGFWGIEMSQLIEAVRKDIPELGSMAPHQFRLRVEEQYGIETMWGEHPEVWATRVNQIIGAANENTRRDTGRHRKT